MCEEHLETRAHFNNVETTPEQSCSRVCVVKSFRTSANKAKTCWRIDLVAAATLLDVSGLISVLSDNDVSIFLFALFCSDLMAEKQ